MASIQIKSAQELLGLPQWRAGLVVLNFWAAWSEPSKQLSAVLDQLAKQYVSDSTLKFAHVRQVFATSRAPTVAV